MYVLVSVPLYDEDGDHQCSSDRHRYKLPYCQIFSPAIDLQRVDVPTRHPDGWSKEKPWTVTQADAKPDTLPSITLNTGLSHPCSLAAFQWLPSQQDP